MTGPLTPNEHVRIIHNHADWCDGWIPRTLDASHRICAVGCRNRNNSVPRGESIWCPLYIQVDVDYLIGLLTQDDTLHARIDQCADELDAIEETDPRPDVLGVANTLRRIAREEQTA